MKRLIIFSLTVVTFFSAVAEKPEQKNAYPYPFKYSDVISDNISMAPVDRIIKDWGANVLMWGKPAISEIDYAGVNLNQEKIRREIIKGKEDGVRIYIGSLFCVLHSMYHKYLAADPTLQEAACRDIAGERMVVQWMVGQTYRGVPLYHNCSNNPRSREFYREVVVANMEAGYDGLVIEEPRGSAHAVSLGGCFCDHCMKGFREYLAKKYTAKELQQRGIKHIENFDYREMVRPIADTRDAYLAALKKKKIPLIKDYKDFQLKAGAKLVGELRELMLEVGGEDKILGLFCTRLGPEWLLNTQHVDFFAAEQVIGPPLDGGYKGLTFRYEIARAMGNPFAWTHISPVNATFIKNHEAFNLVKAWISLAYASGEHFNIPYYAWAFPETPVESWDKRGAKKESCTPHFFFPTERYLPFFDFVTANAELFDGYHSMNQVGVLHSNPSIRSSKKLENQLHDVCYELWEANIPYGLALAGDDWLYSRLSEEDADKFQFVIVPGPPKLDAKQQKVLNTWKANGKLITWNGLDDVLKRIELLAEVESDHQIALRPRKNPDNATVPAVVHLLNMNYDLSKDDMNRQTDVKVRLNSKLMDGKKVRRVTQYSPQCEPVEVPFEIKPDGVYVSVPEVNYWSILKPECE
ncbi:hypothetical protein [Pontiella sulfatireligans]|uniref:Alpha-agarase n=1 Tax=Pontiella sulfatireligans TaxID=2750658 RepID=A0A6C2UQV6_9BACT|nr:hypothetical protein [Pontiella sulfatireligans]VGO22680.1 Alpha-agarase [Pontiella sulfatireligans]